MNTRLTLLLLVIASQATLTSAQEPAAPVQHKRALIPAANAPSASPEAPSLLSSNYRITFSGTGTDNKSLGQLSTLTCAREISLAGPLSDTAPMPEFKVQGLLTEKDGRLVFVYTIGFTVPVMEIPGAENLPRNVNYNNHSSSGTLLMQPGKTYEVLKCGGHTYTITAAPEPDK